MCHPFREWMTHYTSPCQLREWVTHRPPVNCCHRHRSFRIINVPVDEEFGSSRYNNQRSIYNRDTYIVGLLAIWNEKVKLNTTVTNKILTLPNLISFFRLLLVPIFAVLLVKYENNVAAFVLFLVAASTDFLDGVIARATGQVSRLGQQLDPFVDRILILTAVILVFVMGRVPAWILVALMARDALMLLMMIRLRRAGRESFKVVFVGKAATALNMAGFCSLILLWPEVGGLGLVDIGFLPGWGESSAYLGTWLLYIGTILAWVAGIYYFWRVSRAGTSASTAESSTEESAAHTLQPGQVFKKE